MQTQSFDTHPKAEAVQIALLRQATAAKRAWIMRSLSQTVLKLSRRTLRDLHPDLSEQALKVLFVRHCYGEELAERLRIYLNRGKNMELFDTLGVVKPLIQAFDRLGIAYYIGGSVTSSVHGIPRATMDVDLVADIQPKHVALLVNMLEAVYYIDHEMITEAIRRQASFNLIHLETTLKIDVFILKSTAYAQEAFQRRRKDVLDEEQDLELFLALPEDIILSKLDWFRMGGGVSERQWTDVMGVLKIQHGRLDMSYLRHWAEELGLFDLFAQACRDVGIDLFPAA